jgi:hypothetical protein
MKNEDYKAFTALLPRLKELKVDEVKAEYSGSGDSGGIDSTEFTDELGNEIKDETLKTGVEDAVYALLEDKHGGWEISDGINDGATGKLTLHVPSGRFNWTHSANYIKSDSTTVNIN